MTIYKVSAFNKNEAHYSYQFFDDIVAATRYASSLAEQSRYSIVDIYPMVLNKDTHIFEYDFDSSISLK